MLPPLAAVIEVLKRYDMFPRYLDSAAYAAAVKEINEVETKALTDLGLAKK